VHATLLNRIFRIGKTPITFLAIAFQISACQDSRAPRQVVVVHLG